MPQNAILATVDELQFAARKVAAEGKIHISHTVKQSNLIFHSVKLACKATCSPKGTESRRREWDSPAHRYHMQAGALMATGARSGFTGQIVPFAAHEAAGGLVGGFVMSDSGRAFAQIPIAI